MKTLYKEQPEFLLQVRICQYLSLQYPKVLFISDVGSGSKLNNQQANRNAKLRKFDFKIPDMQIIESNENWHGLFLELKSNTPYKKTGGLYASKKNHLQLQDESLKKLRDKGYLACFCWSFEMAKEIIDEYLKK